MVLRDLLVRFGIDVDGGEKLQATDAAIRRTILSAERFGNTLKRMSGYLIVGALVRGLKNFVEGQIRAADELKHNADVLGITTDELQKYEYVSGLMNVSVQQTVVGLRYFNRTIGEAALGTKAAVKAVGALGIQIRGADGNVRPTDELLFEFADKLKNVKSQAERTAYAMRFLGRGGQALLPALQNGSAELRQWFKDVEELGGGFNEQFVAMAHTTDVQLKRMKMGWRSVYVAMATEVLPVFNKWLDRSIRNVKVLIDYAKHTYGFRTALVALTSGAVIAGLVRLMRLFGIGKMTLGQWFGVLLRNAPLVAFVALLTAAYIVLDDLYTFMQGGDSVLGRFLDQIGGQGTALKFWHELKDAFDQIKAAVGPASDSIKELGKSLLKTFIDSIPGMISWGGQFVLFVVKAIDMAASGIKELGMLVGGLFSGILSGSLEGFKSKLSDAWDAVDKDNASAEKRWKAYDNAANVFHDIGNPEALRAKRAAGEEYANTHGTGTREPGGGRAGTPPIQVTVQNNIQGNADRNTADAIGRATKGAVKTALAQHRDTYAAVTAGMPSSGN